MECGFPTELRNVITSLKVLHNHHDVIVSIIAHAEDFMKPSYLKPNVYQPSKCNFVILLFQSVELLERLYSSVSIIDYVFFLFYVYEPALTQSVLYIVL